jgi:hypothetical protein
VEWLTRRVVATPLLLLISAAAGAQGVTTAGIRGGIRAEDRRDVDAHVRVVHNATGFSVDVRSRNGRFLVQGLEPGGPYTVTARGLGFISQRRDGVFLKLGELSEFQFELQPIATRLDTVTVVATGRPAYGSAHADGGTGTTISPSMLEHLPTLNRDLYDFVRLVPQISTRISLSNPGFSAGGIGFRFNNFLINGISERTLSGGVSGAFSGVKSIPLDAVREYQVLLSPYDVRYGDFAGALVNAVTKAGTNAMTGSAFIYGRSDRLARDDSNTPYEKVQYGVSLGGPIVMNKLHFFVASDLQHFTFPAAGPYVGQPESAERPVPVSVDDLARLDAIMRSYGLTAGSPGPVQNGNPQRNIFTRLDLAIPSRNSRLSFWNNYSDSKSSALSRADTFSLSSYRVTGRSYTRTTALQLNTTLPSAGGGHNELLLSQRFQGLPPDAAVQQPIVRVTVPSVSGGLATVNTGTPEIAQGSGFRSSAFTIKDNLTLPFGTNHVVTFGAEAERFRLRRGTTGRSYGAWTFASLDSLALGIADRYEVRIGFGDPDPLISGTQYAAYAGDQWRAGERLSVTGGIRADVLAIHERPPYNAVVDSLFGRRTDVMPRERVELSPRLGFIWDVLGTQRHHIRGGLGVFTGRYPLAWAHTTLWSYGVGGVLRCARVSPAVQRPPAFNPDYRTAPTACLGGASVTPADPGDVDLVERNLRMMRVVRGSLAHDWRLPWNVLLTNEGLITRGLSDFVFLNLNLAEPETSDLFGRVMYGTIGPGGIATPNRRSAFPEVIDVRNTSRNHAYQLSTKLEKSQPQGVSGFVSYTYSRVRDAQTPLRVNNRGTAAWASARATSGRHDDFTAGISSNDLPHRIVVAGTYATRRTRARTELSFYYVGESGRPFTYIAYGALGRGDLNADGSNSNDPIYVPRNALDQAEILFSGFSSSVGADNSVAAQADRELEQRNAFENFVEGTGCLQRRRGRILERNSCREPWSNTTIASVRQAIPIVARSVDVQLDVFNVLNLLNRDWGRYREAVPQLLEHVGQTTEPTQTSRPVFRFATNAAWKTLSVESAFQLQLALRYHY